MPTHQAKTIICVLTFLLPGISCSQPSASEGKITNGMPTAMFPEVTMITMFDGSRCTGTFLSATTLITAAHCVYYAGNSGVMVNSTQSVRVIIHPNYQYSTETLSSDLAFVIFPGGTASATARLATKPATVGMPFIIVGFGANDAETLGSHGVKRVGVNVVQEVKGGFIFFAGEVRAGTENGLNAASAKGDSGGPLFVDGLLAGITSGGYIDAHGRKVSAYVDLMSQESRDFIKYALERGADVGSFGDVPSEPPLGETT